MKVLARLAVAALAARQVVGWGVVGHEIVGTIAQIHLHPSATAFLKQVLPETGGHIGPVAAWADRIRGLPQYRWTGELHYTSPETDYPPETCVFGEKGWKTDHDVIHAIANFTQKLMDNPHDVVSLKFLVHFIGDVHQPLHLTSRERGGNGDLIIFEGRHMSLHGLWDTGLITKAVRELKGYRTRLPSQQIENGLRGTIYDPYIRYILWQGVRVWWRPLLPSWLTCPPPSALRAFATRWLAPPKQRVLEERFEGRLCPMAWAAKTHEVTCDLVFPAQYNYTAPAKEVCTEEYYGPIRDDHVVEKLLAQGGLRLAAILNEIYADKSELALFGPLSNPLPPA